MKKLINAVFHQPAVPRLSPSPQASLFPKTQQFKIILINNPTMASNYSNKRNSRMSQFKLKARNDKAYRGRHVESQGRLKARPFAPVSQAVNEKKKFLNEIKSTTPVNTQILRKENSLIADIKI